MNFVKRTSAPANNKYYIHTSKGGYNKCIKINSAGSCIPNCVGYCYGRFMEVNGLKSCSLPTCNAESWIYSNKTYSEGQIPKLGSIIVWSKGKIGVAKDGAGHVAFVEGINYNSNGSIKSIEISESGYNSYLFKTETIKPPYKKTGYSLVGFIYSPNEFETKKSYTTYIVKSGDTLTKIAKKYNTTINKIASDNGITNVNKIYVGQKLIIK